MTATGSLSIRAEWQAPQPLSAGTLSVTLQRPTAARLFIGQLPAVVAKTVPYLYSLCAQAQRAAAQAALAAAGNQPLPATDSQHRQALWQEVLHESLWRLLLDWPAALGLPPAKDAFAHWRSARLAADGEQATARLLAETLAPLAEQCLARLPGVADDPAPLPELAPATWREDAPPPVPASIAAAYRQRLALVRAAATALQEDRPYPLAAASVDGWGIAQALTARGVLTHAVQLHEGKVRAYRIHAPTDALFADATPLTALLASLPPPASAESARQALEQAILALDPCLPYTLELIHA